MFGWLAGVRNMSYSPTIRPSRGMPDHPSKEVKEAHDKWEGDGHSWSWVLLDELTSTDYSISFMDVRGIDESKWTDRYHPPFLYCPHVTLRDFLGQAYFDEIDKLLEIRAKENKPIRIIFWFDN